MDRGYFSWEEGASLALSSHPSSDAVTIKITYGVDVLLHQPVSQPGPLRRGMQSHMHAPTHTQKCLDVW